MKKRFKRRKKIYLTKLLIYLIFLILGFIISIKLLFNFINRKIDKDEYIRYLINTGFKNQISYDSLIVDDITSNIINVFKYDEIIKPVVYIYNTHDIEEYSSNKINPYNISPNVKLASYYLQERLKDLGIYSLVEERSVYKRLKNDNKSYKYSYEISREFMEDSKNKYSTLVYFIDIHRDSSNKDKTTININGTNYAKILFILGLDNPRYMDNQILIEKLNNYINNNYPNLSRGIYKKSGSGVNGIYNQDFNKNTILIEIGGQYNNIEEVSNTIDILSKSFFEVIYDEKEE